MRYQLLSIAVAACAGAPVAGAHDAQVERKQMCVCSMDGQNMGPGAEAMEGGAQEGPGTFAFSSGDGEERVVIIRRERHGPDDADTNKDGKVSRREFLKKAEKRFEKLDRNGDGSLDKTEAHPPMPPLPPIPGVPPVPPMPPVPPAPPAPQTN